MYHIHHHDISDYIYRDELISEYRSSWPTKIRIIVYSTSVGQKTRNPSNKNKNTRPQMPVSCWHVGFDSDSFVRSHQAYWVTSTSKFGGVRIVYTVQGLMSPQYHVGMCFNLWTIRLWIHRKSRLRQVEVRLCPEEKPMETTHHLKTIDRFQGISFYFCKLKPPHR